jgi:hypothetical protein
MGGREIRVTRRLWGTIAREREHPGYGNSATLEFSAGAAFRRI